jgi:hypothetical protein
VADGGALLDPAIARRLIGRFANTLAVALYIGSANVKSHVSSILAKLGLRDRPKRWSSPTRAAS